MSKEKRISTEIEKLKQIYSDLSDHQKDLVEDLIRKAAFMGVTLEDLQDSINQNGVISQYQNGANQWGTKQNPEVEVYNKIMTNYLKTIKQLADLIPQNNITQSDQLMEFLKG